MSRGLRLSRNSDEHRKCLHRTRKVRFTIPWEAFGSGVSANKRFLILEEERYRFQQAVSDLAGCDIKAHNNEPVKVVSIVKNWLVQEASAPPLSPTLIWSKFLDFTAATHVELQDQHYSIQDIQELPENDLSRRMEAWLEKTS